MMRVRGLLLPVGLTGTVFGCAASYEYTKGNTTDQAQHDSDIAACEVAAESRTGNSEASEVINSCMAAGDTRSPRRGDSSSSRHAPERQTLKVSETFRVCRALPRYAEGVATQESERAAVYRASMTELR